MLGLSASSLGTRTALVIAGRALQRGLRSIGQCRSSNPARGRCGLGLPMKAVRWNQPRCMGTWVPFVPLQLLFCAAGSPEPQAQAGQYTCATRTAHGRRHTPLPNRHPAAAPAAVVKKGHAQRHLPKETSIELTYNNTPRLYMLTADGLPHSPCYPLELLHQR